MENGEYSLELIYKKPGGQIAGSPPVGMKMTHIPTGICISIPPDSSFRSQHRTRSALMATLELLVDEMIRNN